MIFLKYGSVSRIPILQLIAADENDEDCVDFMPDEIDAAKPKGFFKQKFLTKTEKCLKLCGVKNDVKMFLYDKIFTVMKICPKHFLA